MLQKFDPRNKKIKVWIDGALYKREDAKISVFDSLSQGGDAVWEGLRVYDGRIFSLDEHLNRLMESAKSLAFEKTPSIAFIKDAIFTTLKANKMYDATHIRLTLTRGKKITSGMNPQLNQYGCTFMSDPFEYEFVTIGEIILEDLVVFPNPSTGNFIISGDLGEYNGQLKITIHSALCQQVFIKNINVNASLYENIDLTQLAEGLYILELNAEGKVYTQVISIQ